MLRYAITNLAEHLPGSGARFEAARLGRLLDDLERWAASGVDFIQLREKGLQAGEQWRLAGAAMERLHQLPTDAPRPRLLVNGRADIAAAAGADGVHLTARAGELRPRQVRSVFQAAGRPGCLISVSCHTTAEVSTAQEHGSDLILFSPVFEKRVAGELVTGGTGLAALAEACRAAAPVPVLALGGIETADIAACVAAGAAGIAAIRLFASSAQGQGTESAALS